MSMEAPPDLNASFFIRWVLMCQRLDVDPIDLIRVAYSESGCRANAHNPNGHAVGLIQFMPATLTGLGWTRGFEEFRRLPAEEQVPFVERYFRPWAHRMGVAGQKIPQLVTAAHAYVATFLPGRLADVVAAMEGWPNVVLCDNAGLLTWAYRANTVLDRMKLDGTAGPDGKITAGDLATHLDKQCRGPRFDAIVFRLQIAMGQDPPPPPDPPITERDVTAWSVRAVQARLRELGFDPGPVDGIRGPKTDAAVRAFQVSRGLVVDGIVGPKTTAALEH